ncbi:hypothetical protein ACET8I_12260 [Aeromonas veronii]
MTFKFSHVALVFVASASFFAAAENIVPGSQVLANADIVVSQDSTLSLTLNPVANLTVSDIRKGRATTVAKFKVDGSSGDNAAVRLVGANPSYPDCAYLLGSSNKNNKMEVCLDYPSEKFVDNGNTYYKYGNGEYQVKGGGDNVQPTMPVGADTYKLSMELVRYTK